MKIEDQIRRTIEEQLANRPSNEGDWAAVQVRFRRNRRARITAAVASAIAAVLVLTIALPRLVTRSAAPNNFTSRPPALGTAIPTAAGNLIPSKNPPSKNLGVVASKQPIKTTTPTLTPVPAAATTCPPVCRLIQQRNIAAPVGNATGIAFDGKNFWILAGGQNASTNTLTEMDPNTGKVGRQYSFNNLIETQGTGAYGITWDGSDIWISVSGNTNKVVKVRTSDGSIVGTFSSPTILGPSDLDFDGTDIWLSSGTGDVYRIDPATGGIKSTFRAWPEQHRDNGIAVRGHEVWVGGLFGGVNIQDSKTGATPGKVENEQGGTITKAWGPMCFVGNQLVLLDQFGITFYDVAKGV